MTDLAIAVRITSNGGELVRDSRDAKKEIDALKGSVKGTATETKALGAEARRTTNELKGEAQAATRAAQADRQLGTESRKAASDTHTLGSAASKAKTEISGMAQASGSGRAGIANLINSVKTGLPSLAGLGGTAGRTASQLGGLATAAEGGGAAMAAAAAPVAIFAAAIAAAGAGFVIAYNKAADFEEKLKVTRQEIAKAGLGWQISAEEISSASSRIAADSGQAFEDVRQASLSLVSTGKFTADQLEELTRLGALMASTFGGDVVTNTNEVAAAFTSLGAGDARFLATSFQFLDLNTRQTIESLIFAGKTAEAQKLFMEALAGKVHGQPGSASGAFRELISATGDLVGAWLSSRPAIQTVIGWMEDLAAAGRRATNSIRQAAFGGLRPTDEVEGEFNAQARAARRTRDRRDANGGSQRALLSGQFESQMEQLRTTAAELIKARERDRRQSSVSLKAIANQQNQGVTFGPEPPAPRLRGGAGGGSGGSSRVSAEARDAAAAQRELERDLEQVRRAYDPARAAAEDYAETLEKLVRLRDAGKISVGEFVSFSEQASAEELKRASEQLRKESDAFYKSIGVDPAKDLKELVDHASDDFTQALEAYDRVLKEQSDLLDSGALSPEAFEKRMRAAGRELDTAMKKAGKDGADAFRTEGIDAAQAIAQVIGGKLGGIAGKILGLASGAQSGNFNSVGGKLGGLLTLVSGKNQGPASPFQEGVREVLDPIRSVFKTGIEKLLGVFGVNGNFQKTLGKLAGGAVVGSTASSLVLGSKGSATGSAIGGALGKVAGDAIGKSIGGLLGKAAGPLGSIAGGLLGGVIGGLLKKTKTGSAAIGFSDGALTVGSAAGNSAAFKAQATGLAGTVIGGLQTIAEQLGGIISGSPSVSIGIRNGKPVVDPTGANRTKGAGVVKFAKGDEAGAAAFALADSLKDMVISGLSTRVQQALSSSTDVDRALREALKVDEIEQLLGGFGSVSRKAFVDFERQAKERLRLATKYGFDVVELEKKNQEQRTSILEDAIGQATGGLKNLLEELISGDKASGTLLDKRDILLAKKAELEGKAATDPQAAAKLADVLDQLYQVSLEAFGTAGAQFAGDRSGIRSSAEAIIAQATADIKAAQDKARQNAGTDEATTAKLIANSNTLLDEANSQNAQMIALLGRIAGAGGVGGFGGGFGTAGNIGRLF